MNELQIAVKNTNLMAVSKMWAKRRDQRQKTRADCQLICQQSQRNDYYTSVAAHKPNYKHERTFDGSMLLTQYICRKMRILSGSHPSPSPRHVGECMCGINPDHVTVMGSCSAFMLEVFCLLGLHFIHKSGLFPGWQSLQSPGHKGPLHSLIRGRRATDFKTPAGGCEPTSQSNLWSSSPNNGEKLSLHKKNLKRLYGRITKTWVFHLRRLKCVQVSHTGHICVWTSVKLLSFTSLASTFTLLFLNELGYFPPIQRFYSLRHVDKD